MPEFIRLLPPAEARGLLLSQVRPLQEIETLPTLQAAGRICAQTIYASTRLPIFVRATVDGYALRAEDTYGASDSLPAYLALVGEVLMGAEAGLSVRPGQCVLVHTGGMLPDGANAVVMLEHSQVSRPAEIEISRACAVGENVIQPGEDIEVGQPVLQAGQRLGAAEIGGLMALGITDIGVTRRPRVALISSGDEVIPPQATPLPGQVRDVNSYSLSVLVEEAGGVAQRMGIVPDQEQALLQAARQALEAYDLVVITAGSSASARDLTSQVIQALGSPGVLAHGVNLKPGKPTILACCQGKPVIGLPGNPVSALVAARLFLIPVVERLLGQPDNRSQAYLAARLAVNLASQAGREDWIPVKLVEERKGEAKFLAEPIYGRSNLIFNLVTADGLVCIPPSATGLSAGAWVEVYLLR
jgi:molybdopterin molybdotransferase